MVPMIRVATVADADAVAQLTWQLGYDVDRTAVAERLARILDRPDQRFVIAEVAARPVGWIHMLVIECVDHPAFVLIGGLVVDRDHRRRGVGALLLQQAENWARERGCSLVRLSSSATRTAAHRFYERVGYVNVKSQYSFAKAVDEGGAELVRSLVPQV